MRQDTAVRCFCRPLISEDGSIGVVRSRFVFRLSWGIVDEAALVPHQRKFQELAAWTIGENKRRLGSRTVEVLLRSVMEDMRVVIFS